MSFSFPFIDKQDVIRVHDDEEGRLITAHHENVQVGSFEVWDSDDGPLAKFANVIEHYEGAGIGVELLRRAFEYHGTMTPPPLNPALTDNRMTSDGIRLMQAGQRRGWIGPFPDQVSSEED